MLLDLHEGVCRFDWSDEEEVRAREQPSLHLCLNSVGLSKHLCHCPKNSSWMGSGCGRGVLSCWSSLQPHFGCCQTSHTVGRWPSQHEGLFQSVALGWTHKCGFPLYFNQVPILFSYCYTWLCIYYSNGLCCKIRSIHIRGDLALIVIYIAIYRYNKWLTNSKLHIL